MNCEGIVLIESVVSFLFSVKLPKTTDLCTEQAEINSMVHWIDWELYTIFHLKCWQLDDAYRKTYETVIHRFELSVPINEIWKI